MTDSELIAAFKAGDIEALGVLMERHKAAVYGYLLSLTARPDAADDLFQEVFLKLVRNPAAYRERPSDGHSPLIHPFPTAEGTPHSGFPSCASIENKFKAWLFTVARNAAMDYFRRESSRRAEPLEGEDGGCGALDKAVSPEPGPQEALEKRNLGEQISRALERLSSEQREVFYLRHYSELSFKEIAGILATPIGTVLARMSRAAAFLRKELAPPPGQAAEADVSAKPASGGLLGSGVEKGPQ
ncbi:MAG: hypothetical protein A2X34_08600 [Elusimicrobia bacterium GWC2_51_8]|nr:MAG: hypothetical protein A2X33_07945 [Elusimicrobia bacterium GWA2_51_34]OGR58116.1 MAG: hypothetical protein A2X34_08600 [Elusimicrobia bacterium GWC2_51_8]OGR87014.1 MAG: hypothetical protein A2021_04085 [Elusimicrobia bacterium GWF2_52_66]HAF95119.1 hypothetical protein [Elusimicrobiota bacterium]HCE98604.1 hypothetical protein [Elusimicrobiota bacterium]